MKILRGKFLNGVQERSNKMGRELDILEAIKDMCSTTTKCPESCDKCGYMMQFGWGQYGCRLCKQGGGEYNPLA
jgi:hypothetical protein